MGKNQHHLGGNIRIASSYITLHSSPAAGSIKVIIIARHNRTMSPLYKTIPLKDLNLFLGRAKVIASMGIYTAFGQLPIIKSKVSALLFPLTTFSHIQKIGKAEEKIPKSENQLPQHHKYSSLTAKAW